MADFIANSQEYNIQSENEISSVLSHFNTNYIFDIMNDKLNDKYNYYNINNPNIVAAFEQNFKQLLINYPSDNQNILQVREETYKEIIEIICNKYNLQFTPFMNIDYYTAAFHLYDFLVANYNRYIINFFANYIIKERNSIYSMMRLDEQKKNKDSSTLYGKKIFNDPKVAIINANLIDVINSICTFDISINDILSLTFNKMIADFLSGIAVSKNDFFKENYAACFKNPNIYPMLLTDIRLEIQRIFIEMENTQI